MAGHAPYIMPDGKPLAHYLRTERDMSGAERRSQRQQRGKDELWQQLQQQQRRMGSTTATDYELAELRALAAVGHRRRRRWLNDKALRDMAGHMTAHDMEHQFKPIPFGAEPPASAFMEAMSSENVVTWEGFRNIDMDKEARVLQRWEEHNQQLRLQPQQQQRHPGQHACAPAAAAVAAWASVGKTARAALKAANMHSVLELETQVLELMEQLLLEPDAELVLDIDDSFGRLLVHGLAEFHGLLSATSKQPGSSKKLVVVRGKPASKATAAPTTTSSSRSSSGGGAGVAAPGVARHAGQEEVTCTDVLMALHEFRQEGLTQAALADFLRTHVHGSQVDVNSDDFVMV